LSVNTSSNNSSSSSGGGDDASITATVLVGPHARAILQRLCNDYAVCWLLHVAVATLLHEAPRAAQSS
jgi:hypothetical protein